MGFRGVVGFHTNSMGFSQRRMDYRALCFAQPLRKWTIAPTWFECAKNKLRNVLKEHIAHRIMLQHFCCNEHAGTDQAVCVELAIMGQRVERHRTRRRPVTKS
eukprot:3715955-Amphidinium_carterae.1